MQELTATKYALAQSLKSLMAKRSFAKISVADLCENCGMSRKSFYYHFQDKYDLVHWIFQVEFIQTIQDGDHPGSWELFSQLCRYFYQERDFYRRAIQIQGQNSFRDYFCEAIAPAIEDMASEWMEGGRDKKFYTTFFGDAILTSVLRWLSSPQPEPPERYLEHIQHVLVVSAKKLLEELEEPQEESTKDDKFKQAGRDQGPEDSTAT